LDDVLMAFDTVWYLWW